MGTSKTQNYLLYIILIKKYINSFFFFRTPDGTSIQTQTVYGRVDETIFTNVHTGFKKK